MSSPARSSGKPERRVKGAASPKSARGLRGVRLVEIG